MTTGRCLVKAHWMQIPTTGRRLQTRYLKKLTTISYLQNFGDNIDTGP